MPNPSRAPEYEIEPTFLERVDPALNMQRFYRLSIEPTLLGDPALVIEWGRIGTVGRRRLQLYPRLEEAISRWHKIEAAKLRRGYRPG